MERATGVTEIDCWDISDVSKATCSPQSCVEPVAGQGPGPLSQIPS